MGASACKPISLDNRPVVLIIGGGYGGCQCAQKLDTAFNVVVLDPKEYRLHNVAALRASTLSNWVNYVLIPYDQMLCNGHVLRCEVESIGDNSVNVRGVEQPIRFDYLVIATGTRYAFPSKVAVSEFKTAKQLYADACEALSRAGRVLIIGGGPVGCELAGEIKHANQDKEVTLVHKSDRLINPKYEDRFRDAIQSKLESIGVKVRTNCNVDLTATAIISDEKNYLPGTRSVPLSTGESVEVDLIYFCTGARVNSECYIGQFPTDDVGRVKVNEYLQVEGRANVFAVGDCAAVDECQLAYLAGLHADSVAANIAALDRVAPLTPYKPGPKIMLVPVGPDMGVLQYGSFVLTFDWLARRLKSTDLFCHRYWKEMNKEFPTGEQFLEEGKSDEDKAKAFIERLGLPAALLDRPHH